MGGIGTALAVAAVVSAGTSVYAAQEQKKSAKKALASQEAASMESRRIAASGKPMEETATLGLDVQTDTLSQLGLTINPDLEKKKKSALGGVAETGLGSGGVTGALGFGS